MIRQIWARKTGSLKNIFSNLFETEYILDFDHRRDANPRHLNDSRSSP
jgi:hypothetical protein